MQKNIDKKSERFDNSCLFGPFAKIHLLNSENLNNLWTRCNKMKYLEFIDYLFAPGAGTFSFLIANFSVGWVKTLPCSQTTISTRWSCKSRKPIGGKACSLGARSITSRPDNVVRNSQASQNYRQNYVSHLVNGPSGQRGSTSRGKDIVSRRAENINLKLKEKSPVPEENFIWELQFTFHWKRH